MTGSPPDHGTFAGFVEGPANRQALAAARQVAERLGGAANPLVVVGAAGLGKTHLLSAIVARCRERLPTCHVEVESVAGLEERGRGARGGILPLHECDLLVVDDLDLVAQRPDLVPLVLELVLGRVPFDRQVVLASARPPAELGGGGADLARSLGTGLLVQLSAPDPGTRLAILRRRAADLKPALPDEVLTAVASLPIPSVKELLAALQRLVAFQAVSPVPLEPSQARILVGGPEAEAEPGASGPRAGEAAEPAAGAPPPLAVAEDEFGSFLSEVAASVAHQVDRWRAQVGEAILRHGGEGYRTQRLEAMLEGEMPAGAAEALARFEQDVRRLREMEAEAAALVPELNGAPAFRDPDQLEQAEALLAQARTRRDPLPAPSPDYRLEWFGEGAGNRQAVQAARMVVEAPGGRYNPLVIVGSSGTGKTHLLHGIGHALAGQVEGPVACLGAQAFLAEAALVEPGGGLGDWRSRYQYAAAILLDDFHLLAGQPRAQAELLDLLTRLVESGRQVVVTSAVPFQEMAGIDPRLLSRLEGGLVVELPRPDREVRLAVAKAMLAGTPAAGDAALTDWLAARPADSVRAVQGAVRRVLHAALAQGVLPSPALAREVLDLREPARGEARRSGSHLGAGVTGPVHGVARSPEKMVTEWPRLGDRLMEELS